MVDSKERHSEGPIEEGACESCASTRKNPCPKTLFSGESRNNLKSYTEVLLGDLVRVMVEDAHRRKRVRRSSLRTM